MTPRGPCPDQASDCRSLSCWRSCSSIHETGMYFSQICSVPCTTKVINKGRESYKIIETEKILLYIEIFKDTRVFFCYMHEMRTVAWDFDTFKYFKTFGKVKLKGRWICLGFSSLFLILAKKLRFFLNPKSLVFVVMSKTCCVFRRPDISCVLKSMRCSISFSSWANRVSSRITKSRCKISSHSKRTEQIPLPMSHSMSPKDLKIID